MNTIEVKFRVGFMKKRTYVIEENLYNAQFKDFIEGLSGRTYRRFMNGTETFKTPAPWVNSILCLCAVYKCNVRQFKAAVLRELERRTAKLEASAK